MSLQHSQRVAPAPQGIGAVLLAGELGTEPIAQGGGIGLVGGGQRPISLRAAAIAHCTNGMKRGGTVVASQWRMSAARTPNRRARSSGDKAHSFRSAKRVAPSMVSS